MRRTEARVAPARSPTLSPAGRAVHDARPPPQRHRVRPPHLRRQREEYPTARRRSAAPLFRRQQLSRRPPLRRLINRECSRPPSKPASDRAHRAHQAPAAFEICSTTRCRRILLPQVYVSIAPRWIRCRVGPQATPPRRKCGRDPTRDDRVRAGTAEPPRPALARERANSLSSSSSRIREGGQDAIVLRFWSHTRTGGWHPPRSSTHGWPPVGERTANSVPG